MKSESVLKDCSAWSFDEGKVTSDGSPALGHAHAGLTRDSVPDASVHPEDSADRNAPPSETPGAARQWGQKVVLSSTIDPWWPESIRRAPPQRIERRPVLHAEQAVRLAKETFIGAMVHFRLRLLAFLTGRNREPTPGEQMNKAGSHPPNRVLHSCVLA